MHEVFLMARDGGSLSSGTPRHLPSFFRPIRKTVRRGQKPRCKSSMKALQAVAQLQKGCTVQGHLVRLFEIFPHTPYEMWRVLVVTPNLGRCTGVLQSPHQLDISDLQSVRLSFLETVFSPAPSQETHSRHVNRLLFPRCSLK